MPLLAADVQKRILERTGDFDPTTGDPVVGGGGYLEQQMANVWAEYIDKQYVAPRLVELYVERGLLDLYIAALQRDYNFSGDGASFSRGTPVQTLIHRRDAVSALISDIETAVAANRAPAVGQLTTVAPVRAPSPLGIDANSPRYSGSPYYRQPWNYP